MFPAPEKSVTIYFGQSWQSSVMAGVGRVGSRLLPLPFPRLTERSFSSVYLIHDFKGLNLHDIGLFSHTYIKF